MTLEQELTLANNQIAFLTGLTAEKSKSNLPSDFSDASPVPMIPRLNSDLTDTDLKKLLKPESGNLGFPSGVSRAEPNTLKMPPTDNEPGKPEISNSQQENEEKKSTIQPQIQINLKSEVFSAIRIKFRVYLGGYMRQYQC